ncbi:MAG: iron-sulfur cluster assembly protein [Pseudomonadota bacterium]
MHASESLTARERAVWQRLDRVTDPELDEPLTDLGFVEAVRVEKETVTVSFRLPTYWCSPNFAFLMAEGIRREVAVLPWVRTVRVHLEDHMCAEEMNAAVNDGRSFAEALALREEGGDLAEVREIFHRKAFQRRQESVLVALRALGHGPAELAAFTLGALDRIRFEDPEARRQQGRYREILGERGLAEAPGDPAFPDPDGVPLTEAGFKERMSALRAVRINMEFGGALCRGLKQSRYKEVVSVDGEPTLVDFMLDRVPPRSAAG